MALAWEVNPPGRGGQSDPDSYANDVIRAEKARLSISRDFNDVIEQLAGAVLRRPSEADQSAVRVAG